MSQLLVDNMFYTVRHLRSASHVSEWPGVEKLSQLEVESLQALVDSANTRDRSR